MEPSGGEIAAGKQAKPTPESDSAAGEDCDRISALPDDILAQILGPLDTPDAARTCLVARRWRRAWALLPELRVPFSPEPNSFRGALAAHQARLRFLKVRDRAGGADPESLAIWLPAAAARVSGHFVLINQTPEREVEEEVEEGGASVELPCFPDAETISLDLGLLGLAMPPAGVFTQLTHLWLIRVRFHGPSDLDDVLTPARFPCLEHLKLFSIRGLDTLTVRSQTLLKMELEDLQGFCELIVDAPLLKVLSVIRCLIDDPVATISAPRLESLQWKYSAGEMASVQLEQMPHLQSLGTLSFFVYGQPNFMYNRTCVQFLQRFRIIETLKLMLAYLKGINNYLYVMQEMNVLPDVTNLHLIVVSNGHAFGASTFHVLRKCIGIKKLVLELSDPSQSEVQTACPPNCICEQHSNWQTEELLFVRLQEIEIQQFRGSHHEVSFVKHLFECTRALIKVKVTFDVSVTESKGNELCQMFRSFFTPGVCMDFRYHNNTKVLYEHED